MRQPTDLVGAEKLREILFNTYQRILKAWDEDVNEYHEGNRSQSLMCKQCCYVHTQATVVLAMSAAAGEMAEAYLRLQSEVDRTSGPSGTYSYWGLISEKEDV